MRFHVRHTIDMTIHCMTLYTRFNSPATRKTLKDLSEGGLCFQSHMAFDKGTLLHVRIPVQYPAFETTGTVAWCRKRASGYVVGLEFDEQPVDLLCMVGRACEIKHYTREQRKHGRRLSLDQAASEWVAGGSPLDADKVA